MTSYRNVRGLGEAIKRETTNTNNLTLEHVLMRYLNSNHYSQEHDHGMFTGMNVNKTVLDSG